MKILKNIPIPPRIEFEYLLEMEIGDCVEFTDRRKFRSAHSYMYANSFKMRQKKISKKDEPFLARIWRIK